HQPIGRFIFWPAALAVLFFLVGGACVFTGRSWPSLLILIGALVGLTFQLMILNESLAITIESLAPIQAIAYWLSVVGCVVGLLGSLLGFAARRAARATSSTVLMPTPV